jgi:phytoene/squalene synthetase
MCARIFGIEDPAALQSAGRLGDAFQHINFVRDAFDDINNLGRNYFPKDDYEAIGVAEGQSILELEGEQLQEFVALQVNRFEAWLNQGAEGFGELADTSPSIAIAVLTASLLYEKAAARIMADPQIIKYGKVSPTKFEKVLSLIQAIIYVYYFILSGSNSQFEFSDQKLNLINREP